MCVCVCVLIFSNPPIQNHLEFYRFSYGNKCQMESESVFSKQKQDIHQNRVCMEARFSRFNLW